MWLCNPVRSCIYRLYEIPSVHWKRCPVFFSCKFFLFPWILTSCPGHVFSMSAVSLDTSWPWHRFSLGISFSGHCPFLQISFSQHRFLPKSIPLDISSSSSLSRDTIFLDIRFFTSFPEISCPWHPLTWQSHYIVIFSSLPPCLSWHFFLLWLLVLWSGVSCFSLSACGDIWFPYGSISFLISFSRHRLLPSLDIAPRPGSRHPPAPAMQPSPQKNHWVAKRCKTNTFQTSPGRRPGRSR